MLLKKAHSLCQAALNPKNIEKTSTKLALSVFCEPTRERRDALQFYCKHEGRTTWQGRANFLSLIKLNLHGGHFPPPEPKQHNQ